MLKCSREQASLLYILTSTNSKGFIHPTAAPAGEFETTSTSSSSSSALPRLVRRAATSSSLLVHTGLLHELRDALLEVVNARSHLVDAANDRVAHGLEAALHLLQQLLHEKGQVLRVLRVTRVAASGHLVLRVVRLLVVEVVWGGGGWKGCWM